MSLLVAKLITYLGIGRRFHRRFGGKNFGWTREGNVEYALLPLLHLLPLLPWFFSESVPTPASSVLLAVGPFEVLPDETGFTKNISVTHFCLPGRRDSLMHEVNFYLWYGAPI